MAADAECGNLTPTVTVGLGTRRPVRSPRIGQSNQAGAGLAQAVTTTAPYPHRALMPNIGRIIAGNPADISGFTDFASAKERGQETKVTSGMRWALARETVDNILLGLAPATRFSYTVASGGQSITAMLPGGPLSMYENSLAVAARSAVIGRRYGLRPFRTILHGDQGEKDRRMATATYVGHANSLQTNYQRDFDLIDGNNDPIHMTWAQLAATGGGIAAPTTALAHQQLVEQGGRFHINCPGYLFPHAVVRGIADWTHFAPLSHAIRAEYEAKAERLILRAMDRASDPWSVTSDSCNTSLRPDPRGIERVGVDIYIGLLLPADGTVVEIDTTTLRAATCLGYYKRAGTGGDITDVEIVTGQTINGKLYAYAIHVTLASAGSATLDYAYQMMDPDCAFTGEIVDTTLTVTAVASGVLATDYVVRGGGAKLGTTITRQLTGTPGGVGTYSVGTSQMRASAAMIGWTKLLSSAWGNIRDNCDENSLADPGRKLCNWLITHRVAVA